MIKSKKREVFYQEDLPLSSKNKEYVSGLSQTLCKQIEKQILKEKYAPISAVLKFVGAGAFLAASIAVPTLPMAIKPFLKEEKEWEVWKRFNLKYLKRTLKRLEKEKLVEISEEKGFQVVKITDRGSRRILRYALDELSVEKPRSWDGRWRLLSYDIPKKADKCRKIFREYLDSWGFYPLHDSVFLHAYPCEKQIEFLREYLGIGEYVRFFEVTKIENDSPFREFFGV